MSLAVSAIFQGQDTNIFRDVVPTSSVDPMDTYSLTTFSYLRPDENVRFGSGTVELTWTLGSPALGDILIIPKSSLVDGYVSITNGAGLNQNVPVSAPLRNGISRTIALDLSVLTPSSVTRTSNVWHLIIAANPNNVTLGGCIALYSPKTMLGDRDFKWGYTRSKTGFTAKKTNEYGIPYVLNMQTSARGLDLETLATDDDADALEGWFDANNCGGLPGTLWIPGFEDACFGYLPDTFQRIVGSEQVPDTNIIKFTFSEHPKGLPLS